VPSERVTTIFEGEVHTDLAADEVDGLEEYTEQHGPAIRR
jgi:hypothetical protein